QAPHPSPSALLQGVVFEKRQHAGRQQMPPAQCEWEHPFFSRSDKPYGAKREAFQTEKALSGIYGGEGPRLPTAAPGFPLSAERFSQRRLVPSAVPGKKKGPSPLPKRAYL
ncbi:hypothetical protein, partial [uncultured Desulfovibrio sp.]|uniref:hypothetical protein n=1 Tax=uncultured Desulfovibrio sp. TaxID=167968 RepID=UPI00320B1370